MKTKQLTEEKVFAYIRKHHMLEPGDRVVAGISGGADSVCLLFVLLAWARQMPIELTVVHVNHGIRREAGDDAAYVESLCREHNIPFYLITEDVPARAALEKCSEEDAGRRVRYEAFARVAEERDGVRTRIAVAHNSNDRSETMLFHLFRGSGIKGLSSIQPVRDNIIRPILCLERREIEDYLEKQGISYCQDATNATDDYTRNRIRHHILPYVEQEIVQGGVAHMCQTAELLSETEEYLEQQTRRAIDECTTLGAERYIFKFSIHKFLQNHPVIQKRILHKLVSFLSPEQKDISYVHIRDLLELFTREGNRTVCLPFGIRGCREYDIVYLKREMPGSDSEEEQCKESPILFNLHNRKADGEPIVIDLADGTGMICTLFDTGEAGNNIALVQESPEFAQNEYTKWFDYDKIKGYIAVRCRQIGDYLTIADRAGGIRHKSLKDYMISQKIPATHRDKLLLLAEEEHVIWLPGYRISEYYKISENTKRILQVQLIREAITKVETEENHGRTY